MEIKVYKSINEVNEDKWDAIVGRNRLICRHKYIEAIEKSQINDCRFYYPVVYEAEEIIAHTSVYYISTELDSFARGITKKVINKIRRFWKGFLILRTLECGTPVALGNTISFRNGVNQPDILKLLCRGIERLAKELHVNVVLFRDFYDEELRLFDNLAGLGYNKINNLPSSKIEVKWNNFDEYLGSMRKFYRKQVVKYNMKLDKEDIVVQLVTDFSIYANELEKLWINVYDRAKEYKRERLTAVFFTNIDKYLGNRSAVILIKKQDIPIAFSLLLFDEDTLIPLFCGLDYNYNEMYDLYFNILCKGVEIGIRRGMKEIDMGITTLVPKKEIGAVVVPLNMYIKHFDPVLNKIISKIFGMMTPKDNSGPRRVFKTGVQNKEKDDQLPRHSESKPENVSIKAE